MNNSVGKGNGKITRRQITNQVKEESITDFVILCHEMEPIISKMVIDEDKNYVLTRHTKTKKGVKITESDHMSIITEVKGQWNKNKNIERIEIYNFNIKEGLKNLTK